MATGKIYLTEIFYSIQGEGPDAGYPCVFLRLSGCDLRCRWCDTTYSFSQGKGYTLEEVLEEVGKYSCERVEITGGEPLLQRLVIPLMEQLLKQGKRVLLETGGHRSLAEVPSEVVKIMDVKCPGSGMSDKNNYENFQYLSPSQDAVKFVLASFEDYQFAREVAKTYRLPSSMIYLSPVWGELSPKTIAEWVLKDQWDVRLQLQLHKILELP